LGIGNWGLGIGNWELKKVFIFTLNKILMKALKISFYIFLAIVLILGIYVVQLLWMAGSFKRIQPHFGGTVKAIKGHPGMEDITIDPNTGIAYISADDRRNPTIKGKIYSYDLKSESKTLIDLSQNFKEDFHPHGICLFQVNDDKLLLFVVNHRLKPQKRHTIEIFEVLNDNLVHIRTLENPVLLTSPNDVIAVAEDKFYVTNDHYHTEGWYKLLEEYGQMRWSYVNYFDGKDFRIVAKDIAYANGINISHDKKTVYVASPVGRKIIRYTRNEVQGNLIKMDEIWAGTGVDNIELDEKGNLWVGCHPQMLAFVAHSKNAKRKSPSQVIKISADGKQVDEVFLNNGQDFSGSTVGAVWKQNLLIGSVFEPMFLECTLP
jgi:arylesterase / paraoxonase